MTSSDSFKHIKRISYFPDLVQAYFGEEKGGLNLFFLARYDQNEILLQTILYKYGNVCNCFVL